MFRYKSFKTTLIIAALVILLCLVCITGATFALFTDTSGDGKIGINTTSGNLAVDIVDAKDQGSLVGEVLDFITTSEDGQALFEPGATFRTIGFCVKNVGNIPLDYILYISEDETLAEDFAEAFDVWITTDPTNRDSAVKLSEFEGFDLAPTKTSEVYYLVVSMKTTAGNEFQDRTFMGIGITVCAVQGNGYINRD